MRRLDLLAAATTLLIILGAAPSTLLAQTPTEPGKAAAGSKGKETTAQLEAQVRALKGITTKAQLWKALTLLTGTGDELRQAAQESGEGDLLQPQYLERADFFRVNLDRDPRQESVTQLIFAKQTGRLDSPMLYIILVHDDPAAGAGLLHRSLFPKDHCGYGDKPGLTLHFKRQARGKRQVWIRHTVYTSCGTTVSGHRRVDRLVWRKGKLRLKRGKPVGSWSVDRMDLAR